MSAFQPFTIWFNIFEAVDLSHCVTNDSAHYEACLMGLTTLLHFHQPPRPIPVYWTDINMTGLLVYCRTLAGINTEQTEQ